MSCLEREEKRIEKRINHLVSEMEKKEKREEKMLNELVDYSSVFCPGRQDIFIKKQVETFLGMEKR